MSKSTAFWKLSDVCNYFLSFRKENLFEDVLREVWNAYMIHQDGQMTYPFEFIDLLDGNKKPIRCIRVTHAYSWSI